MVHLSTSFTKLVHARNLSLLKELIASQCSLKLLLIYAFTKVKEQKQQSVLLSLKPMLLHLIFFSLTLFFSFFCFYYKASVRINKVNPRASTDESSCYPRLSMTKHPVHVFESVIDDKRGHFALDNSISRL